MGFLDELREIGGNPETLRYNLSVAKPGPYNNQIKSNKKEVKKMAKLSVKNVNVVGSNVELTLNISGINSAAAMKVQNLISVIQAAAADGKFSFSEDLAIGLAFGMLFAND